MRRLRTRVAHLPRDSAVARVMGWWWSDELELQALTAEIGHAHFAATLAVAGVKKSQLPKPLNLTRPSPEGGVVEVPEPERKLTANDIDAFLMGR